MAALKFRPDRIRRLADRVEGLPYGSDDCDLVGPDFTRCETHGDDNLVFNMKKVSYYCDTPGCMIGHARLMAREDGVRVPRDTPGSTYLGLTDKQAEDLFTPEFKGVDDKPAVWSALPGEFGYIPAPRAAAVLRHLADTKNVDWNVGWDGEGEIDVFAN